MDYSRERRQLPVWFGRGMEVRGMWHWLEENHPVLYEVIQWGILALALAALIHEMLQ